jgi:hypothetical protein
MRIFYAAVAAIALLAAPAYGQQRLPAYGDLKGKSPQDIAAEKEAERAYQKALGNIPVQKETDPWGAVRSDNAPPKAVAKDPAAKRTKAGGTAN